MHVGNLKNCSVTCYVKRALVFVFNDQWTSLVEHFFVFWVFFAKCIEYFLFLRPNLNGIGRSASNQYTAWCGGRHFAQRRARSAGSRARCPRRHSGALASIVIPFSARLSKLKCRNSWGNIGFLPKKIFCYGIVTTLQILRNIFSPSYGLGSVP